MHVHLLSHPAQRPGRIPRSSLTLLAAGLQAAGCTVTLDDGGERPGRGRAATPGAGAHPDVIHALGVPSVVTALENRPPGVPVVASFDDWPAPAERERRLADQVDAVLPLSMAERDQWRRLGVPTLSSGVCALPMAVPDPDATAAGAGGAVVTLSSDEILPALVEAMPAWGRSHLVVLARLPEPSARRLLARARSLGVADRLELRPGLRGAQRDAVWRRASLLVAGSDGARHGGHVLEAAAHGVPALATAQAAHLDHVIAGVTGLLVEPGAGAGTIARAVAPLLRDPMRARALGAAALLRVQSLHEPRLAGGRLESLYEELLPHPAAPLPDAHGLSEERCTLALEHLSLASQLAQWYTGRGQSMDDLVQVASLGLVRAAERFDPSHGKEFHSFAIPTILGELRRHFRDHAWAVRVPRGLQETTLLVQRTSEELRQALGHEASEADIAGRLGLVEEEVRQARQAQGEARASRSLDHPVGEGGTEVFGDIVGAPDPALDLVEQVTDVRAALRKLPEREREIVLLRFYGERTQSEIAEQLGISQVHVSRVLSRTLSAVRDHVLYDVPLPAAWSRDVPRPRTRTA